MKNKIFLIILVLVAIGSYILGGTVQYNHDLTNGKTAQEWAKVATSEKDIIASQSADLTRASNYLAPLYTNPSTKYLFNGGIYLTPLSSLERS